MSEGLVGDGPAMRQLAGLIDRVSRTSSPVLIVGETGTGKELVARAIHVASDRSEGPFVAVSCAALPEALLESELFGHASGEFPEVPLPRRGLFTAADGGTIFIDEVADLPLALQGRLLRVLESREIRTVGGDASHVVDVRCIASTNKDLATLVRARTFREDLFFRLDVLPIRVPPLRERREDIPLLVDYMMSRAQEYSKDPTRRRLTSEALHVLQGHAWPGNVRELENVLQRVLVTATRSEIDAATVTAALTPIAPADPLSMLAAAHLSLEAVENRYDEAVLRQTCGNKASAATILGVDVSTLYRRARHRRG